MRLFIAFDVDSNITSILKKLQHSMNSSNRLSFPHSFHLTLKFLGEVSDDLLPKILSALSQIKFNSFDAQLSNMGVFPNKSFIRVVWVGLDPEDKIICLQSEIDSCLDQFGFKKDIKFHPHLTVARVKFLEDSLKFLDSIDALKFDKACFKVNSFKLYKSDLTQAGPVYTCLGDFCSD